MHILYTRTLIIPQFNVYAISVLITAGVTLSIVATSNINESARMTRDLCVQLLDFGRGLERAVMVTLDYKLDGFATKGM